MDGIPESDAVINAKEDIRARIEKVKQLVQSPLLDGWGEGSHDSKPVKIAIGIAVKSLTDPGSLCKGKQGNKFLSGERSNVLRG